MATSGPISGERESRGNRSTLSTRAAIPNPVSTISDARSLVGPVGLPSPANPRSRALDWHIQYGRADIQPSWSSQWRRIEVISSGRSTVARAVRESHAAPSRGAASSVRCRIAGRGGPSGGATRRPAHPCPRSWPGRQGLVGSRPHRLERRPPPCRAGRATAPGQERAATPRAPRGLPSNDRPRRRAAGRRRRARAPRAPRRRDVESAAAKPAHRAPRRRADVAHVHSVTLRTARGPLARRAAASI
jgi:hypothetical protein